MIATITTAVVYCDAPNCDPPQAYADVVEVSEETAARFARRDGWKQDAGGKWTCPRCQEKCCA